MSSVGDVDPAVTAAPDDELSQRAAAAARAFAALHLDEDGDAAASPYPPTERVTDPETASAGASGTAGDRPTGTGTMAGAGTTTRTATTTGPGTATGGGAGAGAPRGGTAGAGAAAGSGSARAGDDEGPLRPDAVFQGFVSGTGAPGAPGPTAAPGDEQPGWRDRDGRRRPTARAWPGGGRRARPHPTGPGAGSRRPASGATWSTAGDHGSADAAAHDVPRAPVPGAAGAGTPAGDPAGRPSGATSPGFDPPVRRIDRHLLDLGAAAVASVAFVSPVPWLAVVAVAAGTGAVLRSLVDHGPWPGGVARRAVRRVRAAFRLRTLPGVVVILVHGALTAVLVPAALAMAWWAVRHGAVGVLAAGRSGVWAQAPRAAAALVCYALVAGLGPVRERRIAQVRQLTGHVSGSTVAAVAVGAVSIAVVVTTAVPRADGGPLASDDGLGWAPPAARHRIDRLRDVMVQAELSAAAGCLNGPNGLRWDASYTANNPNGDEDVARLTITAGLPTPGHLTTAAAALHNQLAPWVETIELAGLARPLLVVDRTELPSSSPLADPEALAEAATQGRALVEDGIEGFDRGLALDCSASPVL
ncbi:MAG TPA: hypothetical protein VFH36_17540 [Acidimicrobiales bacterium]|nr:hypothetical protein [Acidimicrobiales bacterium]